MANKAEHMAVSVPAGAFTALYRARNDESFLDAALEVAGGGVGGWLGGCLPDWIEPAVHSFHRDIFHSVACAAALVEGGRRGLHYWETYWRDKAASLASDRAASAGNLIRQIALLAAEALCRLMAGFASGLVAGYVSHLALDARTPRSIPLIARKIV